MWKYLSLTKFYFEAVAGPDCLFTIIDVGAPGRQSDGGTFQKSTLNRQLQAGTFPLPSPRIIPGHETPLPYFFIGDEAFRLDVSMMRPFPKSRLNTETKMFNLKLARARQVIECAFGILAAKWRCLRTQLEVSPDTADKLVKACCLLHNIIIHHDGDNYHF